MKKIFFGIFLILILGLSVISGCNYINKKQTVGKNILPDGGGGGGGTPINTVTYQGVLNMLKNNCETETVYEPNINCNQECQGIGKTCIFWFSKSSKGYIVNNETLSYAIHECAIGETGAQISAICMCCSPTA